MKISKRSLTDTERIGVLSNEKSHVFGAIFLRGGSLCKDLVYQGDSLQEIARQIDKDNNALLEYMRTHDFKNEKSFCLFIFQKGGLLAAQLKEPDI